MNVLHILKNSFPEISGSTVRSNNILTHQSKFLFPLAYTGYNFKSDKKIEIINNISYFRFGSKKLRKYNSFIQKLRKFIYYYFRVNINFLFPVLEFPISWHTKRTIKKAIKLIDLDIDIIHQHSDVQIGKFSQKIAKKLNIPYIYEVRAFLEDGIIVESRNWKLKGKRMEKFVYNNLRNRETKIMKRSDKITTLCPLMEDEIISRGIAEKKVYVVPNSVNELKETNNRKNVNTKEKLVISYIGTMEEHEGIHVLLKAIWEINLIVPEVQVFLVGRVEENYRRELESLIKDFRLEKNVRFLGVVDHNKIKTYYDVSNFIVIPRLNRRVCRMVSPIKPLEAMNHGKLVITSNLPAMRYYIEHCRTGVLFEPENEYDLANKILYFIEHDDEKEIIEKNAKKHVIKNFNWKKTILKYKEIYEELIK